GCDLGICCVDRLRDSGLVGPQALERCRPGCRRAGVGGAGERPLRLDPVAAAAAKEPARQSKAHQHVAGRPLSDRRTAAWRLLNLDRLLLIALALVLLDHLDRTPDCP